MSVTLDDLDKALLKILQDDARTSFAEMARLTGVSESTVRFRVRRLVARGVITRFTALVDPRKVGLPIVLIAMLKVSSNRQGEVFDKIIHFKEALHAFQCTGRYDLVAIFHARDIDHLNEWTGRLRGTRGVGDVDTMIATGLVKVETRLEI